MVSENIDSDEIARFAAQADAWWDRRGAFKALHDINPVRLDYVRQQAGLCRRNVLDVGCGGGLMAEAMAAEGARVTAIDMSDEALAAAAHHMALSGLAIDYRRITVEQMARRQPGAFDVVTCMELVEHVPDPASVIRACARLLRPGGHLVAATVNRTLMAGLLVILLSEYVLRIVARGTHQYRRFVRPAEISAWARDAGLTLRHRTGLRYLPFVGYAGLCRSMRLNYLVHFTKPS